jgi:catechol 2,3-dioxygenase-like lactoylglutathione lyase family enzyme/quercetin dioxygenase-like cupin family protein
MAGRYPSRIKSLPLFDGRFDAYRLAASGADVLFASYPAGTSIPAHVHDTDNYGVITRGALILRMQGATSIHRVGDWHHVPGGVEHAAEFAEETDEIEFWFAADRAADPTTEQSPPAPMRWNPLVPELLVEDYQRSKDFYQKVFGFRLCYERPEDRFGYFELEGSQLMLLQAAEPPSCPGSNGQGIHFQVDVAALSELQARMQAAAVVPCSEVGESWYRADAVEHGQREFFVTDPDGYLFRFCESLGERAATIKA